MLADLLGPTAALTSFLEDATNLLNGLLSQVPKALWRLVLGLIVPAAWLSTILGKPVNRVARSPPAWRVAAPPTTGLLPPPLGVAGQIRFGLLCRGDAPSMTVLKEGRRRGPNAEPPVRSFGNARACAADGCATRLSRYNPAPCCYLHKGWDLEQRIRPRRHAPESPLAPTTADDRPSD